MAAASPAPAADTEASAVKVSEDTVEVSTVTVEALVAIPTISGIPAGGAAVSRSMTKTRRTPVGGEQPAQLGPRRRRRLLSHQSRRKKISLTLVTTRSLRQLLRWPQGNSPLLVTDWTYFNPATQTMMSSMTSSRLLPLHPPSLQHPPSSHLFLLPHRQPQRHRALSSLLRSPFPQLRAQT